MPKRLRNRVNRSFKSGVDQNVGKHPHVHLADVSVSGCDIFREESRNH